MTRDWWRSPLALAGVASALLVVVLDVVLRNLPGPASGATLFVGRFHPLAVHLPIGVVLLVAAAEVASLFPRYRERVDAGIGLTLPVLLAGALGAFLLGHLLARSGGFPARSLVLHRRLELLAIVGVGLSTVAWAYQTARGTPKARNVYRGVFGLTLAVLTGGAHFGGTMTRGDAYLSKYAPSFLAPFLGGVEPREGPAAPAPAPRANAEPLLFADVVLPILRQRCAECHGEEKTKGELRLDSLAAIQRGGESGAAIVPGSPEKSPLLTRMLLPPGDDDRMPPEGKPGPTPAERDVIRFWIERGATDALRVRDALSPVNARGVLERALGAPPASGIPAQGAAPTSADPTASSAKVGSAAPPAGDPASAGSSAPGSADTHDAAEQQTLPASTPPPVEPRASDAARTTGSAQGVLREKCGDCHGAGKQKGKLRVDSLGAMLAGGKHGPAVVPGRPGESLLVKRVELPLEADGHMPPKDKPQLDAAEFALLASFVRGLSTHSGAAPPVSTPPRTSAEADAGSAPAATTEPGEPVAASAPPEPAGATPPASPAPADDPSPPDAELLARLPARVNLLSAGVAALLSERCAKCHGGQFPAGNLSVADHASLLRGGNGGPAVVPGELEVSTLWQRVSLPLADGDHMPPEEEPQLAADELALLRAFILRGGAEGATVATSALSAGAVRALAARAPASSPPPSAAPRTAGCGACTVGESPKFGSISRSGALLALIAFAWRRGARPRRSA